MKRIDFLHVDWRKKNPPLLKIPDLKSDFLSMIAVEFLKLIVFSQKTNGHFSLILGGGRTPKLLNPIIVELAKTKIQNINWSQVYVFFSDERCVPQNHPDSNYKLILETLIIPLGIPHPNIFRIQGEIDPVEASANYHLQLSTFNWQHSFPVFDLALLGLGSDGHTASLFPHNQAIKEFKDYAVPAGTGPDGWERVTVTLPIFDAAKNVWIMAKGAEKKWAVQQLLHGEYNPERLPAQAIRPKKGELIYWLDSSTAPI